jgi:hypothetical protein
MWDGSDLSERALLNLNFSELMTLENNSSGGCCLTNSKHTTEPTSPAPITTSLGTIGTNNACSTRARMQAG